jgi:hypothetical protein
MLARTPFFLIPAALAAQAQTGMAGFRQRDVRFFSDLFSNWVQFGGIGVTQAIHNTQVLRFMLALSEDHQAKEIVRGKSPKYRLTRAGVFNLISFLVNRSYLSSRPECLLTCYFIKSYSRQLKSMVAASSQEFSRAHKIEIEALLDLSKFIERQISLINNEVVRLNERIEAANEIDRDYQQMARAGAKLDAIAKYIGENHPYELNSNRNFSQLLASLPDDVLQWEVSQGFQLRARLIFTPLKEELIRFKESLISFGEGGI